MDDQRRNAKNTGGVIRGLVIAALVLAVALPVVACGRKSSPESPPGSTYPRQYPAPQQHPAE